MHNPSKPFSLASELRSDELLRELATFSALPLRWTDKKPRVIAHSLAAALDNMLHPLLVFVELRDSAAGEPAIALAGEEGQAADAVADKWRALFAPLQRREAGQRAHYVTHPGNGTKLRVAIAAVGPEKNGGYIALASPDPAFPRQHDSLFLDVAVQQAAIGLEHVRLSRARTEPVSPAGDTARESIEEFVAGHDDGIEILDRNWRLTYVNDMAVQIIGRPRERLLGVSLWDVFPDVVGSDTWQRLHRVMEQRESVRFDVYYDVLERWFDVRARPLDEGIAIVFSDITARKRQDEARHVEQLHWHVVSEALPALIAYVDRQHVYRFVSRRYEEWFGQRPADLIGRHVKDVIGDEVYRQVLPSMQRALSGDRVTFEMSFPHQADGTRYVVGSYMPDRDAHGTVRGFFSLVQDITDATRTKQALQESEERFRRLADTAPVLIWMTDEDKRTEYVNKRWIEFTGQSPEQALTEDWSQYMHPDDRATCVAQCLECFDVERPFTMNFRLRRKDGAYRWFSDSALPRYDADGKFRGFIGTMVDITEHKEIDQERNRMLAAEREARSEAELLRDLGAALNSELDIQTLLQRVTDAATAVVGAEFGAFFYNTVNEQGESYTLYTISGVPREAFAKFPLPRNTDLFGPTYRGEGVVRSDDVRKDPRYGKSEPHYGMPPGHLPVTSYLAVPVRSRSGIVLGGLFFGHKEAARFTERHERIVVGIASQAAVAIDNVRLIDAAREQAERLRITRQQAPMGIGEADLTGRFVAVNDRFCQILGYAREELLGRRSVEFVYPEDSAADMERFGELVAGKIDSYEREKRYVCKDGRVIWGRVSVALIRDAHGKPHYVVGMLEDITERHTAEERARFLAEASKRLAGSLDYKETLNYVARLAVPALADWCVVEMLRADGTLKLLAMAHVDPSKVEAVAEMRRRYPLDQDLPHGPYHVVRTGQSELVSDITESILEEAARDRAHLDALRSLQLRSYICVPLIARERVLGVITWVQSESGRNFDETDRAFVEELARRAATAIDNAMLFQAVREQAARLQATYESAPIGIAEARLDGHLFGANDRFCAITGYTREELIERSYVDLTHPDDRQKEAKLVEDLLAGKAASYGMEKRYIRKDGRILWVYLTVSLVRDAQGQPQYAIGAVEDITERRRAETVITGQKKALEQMAHGEPLAAVLETLVDTFDRQSTTGAHSMVTLLDNDHNVLRPVAVGQLPAEWVEQIREVPVGANSLSCGAAAHSGSPVFVPDISADPRWESGRELVLRLGYRSASSICLRSSANQTLGTFDILYKDVGTPSDGEMRFFELVTDTLSAAIERYRDEESLHLQAQVLSRIHDAVVMLDLNGHVMRWNEGAERLFGYRADEALGQHLSDICSSRTEYAWLEKHVMKPARQEGRLERVVALRRRSGDVVHVHLSLSLLPNAQGVPTAFVGYMLDVTERMQAEKELSVRVRQQAAVARLGQAALSGVPLQELLDEAVGVVANTLGVELCKVLELLPDGKRLMLRAGVGWREGLIGQATVGAGLESQAGYTLTSDEPVLVENLAEETRFVSANLLRDHAVVSGMSVVIQGELGRPYGVLSAHSKSRRTFSDNDVNFLRSVAHVLATAIQRKRFEAAMRQVQEDLERRVDERTSELARANQSLRDEVVERMGVENALRDSEAQYRMLFERNPLSAWVFDINSRHILAANETAIWQYGYTRDEFLRMNINDLHPPEEAARALDYAGQFPPETAYVGVWKHRKQDETVIDVEVFVYEVLFQGRWARLMLANDITERRRTEQEFRLIETITRAVSEARDVDDALYAVLKPISQWTGWLFGEAWVPTPDQQRMQCSRAWYCGADGLEEFRAGSWERQFRSGEGLVGRAWATRQPVWMPDVTTDEAFLRGSEARAAGLRTGIAFPVLAEGEVVALIVFFLREPRFEDEHQVKLVSTVAAQVGIAIQRKRAEERLRESEERFRLLVEGAHDYAIYMLDVDGKIASWNKGAERLNGYSADEVVGQPIGTFYAPEDAARGEPARMLQQVRTEGVVESEGWRIRKDGSRFWASITITALRDAGESLRGFVKVTRDITERKRAEERLRESEARLVRAQEFSLLMVAHTALDGRWLKVPPLLCATLAYRDEELLELRVKDVTHPDDFEAEWVQCERLARGEAKSFDIEKRLLRRDGKVIWVYQNTSVVLDAEDRPLHFLTFLRDITQRKEAEEQLRRSQIQLNEAQRLAHLGSWEWEIATGRVEWSDELYRIYGIESRSPVTFESYIGHLHPEDRERVSRSIKNSVATQQPFTLEERIVRSDGEVRYLLSHGAVVSDPRGDVSRMVGVCLDITERKLAEERLRDYTHRLQNLSTRLLEAQETERRRIARELHDQIGQDLSVIKINLQTMQRLPGSAVVSPHVDETLRVVEGVLQTARNLSVELRPSMLDDLGLAAALRWYLDRQAQRAGITLQFTVDMLQVRINPTIETACFRLAQEALTNVLRHANAHHVQVLLQQSETELELRILDDGQGFDVEAARTRAARGDSFGLLGMEERALLAGGGLEIISTPGQGTTVIARFPLTLTSGHNHELN